MMSMVDSFAAVPWMDTIFKSPEVMKQLVGDVANDACSLFSMFQSGDLDVGNMVQYLPKTIGYVQQLRSNLPDFLSVYIPNIPSSCNPAYTRIADAMKGKTPADMPSSVCVLPQKDLDCIGDLGRAIDGVDMLKDATKGLGGMLGDVVNAGCEVLTANGNTDAVVAVHMPTIIKLITTVLPIEASCEANLNDVASKMAESASLNAAQVCDIESSCAKNIFDSLRSISFLKDVVPEGLEVLLEVSCPLLDGNAKADVSYFLNPAFMDKLPLVLRVSGDIARVIDKESVTDECKNAFHEMAANPIAGQPMSHQTVLSCGLEGRSQCLGELLNGFRYMPVVGEKVAAVLDENDQLINMVLMMVRLMKCRTKSPTMPPNGCAKYKSLFSCNKQKSTCAWVDNSVSFDMTHAPTFKTMFIEAAPTSAPTPSKTCGDIASFMACIRNEDLDCEWAKGGCKSAPGTRSPTLFPTKKPTTAFPTRKPTGFPTPKPTKAPTAPSCERHRRKSSCTRE